MTIASTSHRLDLHNSPLEARSKLAACPQGCDESHSRKDAMGALVPTHTPENRANAWLLRKRGRCLPELAL